MEVLKHPELLYNYEMFNDLSRIVDILPNIKFILADELLANLYQEENSLIYNPQYSNVFYKFISQNTNTCKIADTTCSCDLKIEFQNNDLYEIFLKLIHQIIIENRSIKNFYRMCLEKNCSELSFYCNCHSHKLTGNIINTETELISKNINEIIQEYWPISMDDFNEKFYILLKIFAKLEYNCDFEYMDEDIVFESSFIKDFIKMYPSKRLICIKQITKKVILPEREAIKDTSLQDEAIKKTHGTIRRFRLEGPDRVHYSYIGNNKHKFLFKEITINNHEKGLNK